MTASWRLEYRQGEAHHTKICTSNNAISDELMAHVRSFIPEDADEYTFWIYDENGNPRFVVDKFDMAQYD